MHVGLIVDDERLGEERRLLEGLVSGFDARGARVTAMGPAPAPDALPATWVVASFNVPFWARRARVAELAGVFGGEPPDVLYAMGVQAWTLGAELARILDRPATLEVSSAAQAHRVPNSRAAGRVSAYIAATQPIAELLHVRVDAHLVSHVPLGVPSPPEPRRIMPDPEGSIALAVIGSGIDLTAYRALLGGLRRVIGEFPQLHVCMELRGPHEHDIWREAQKLELLSHLSTVVDGSRHRPLLTACDILIRPERSGEVRSLTLQAMAAGMAVLAGSDPFVDFLLHERTALLIEDPDPEEWAAALRRIAGDPELARSLGQAAAAWATTHHRVEDHVDRLLEAFEQVLSGGAHSFLEG